jgi:hypothetical protein
MATVKIRNISPLGHLDLPLIRREGDPLGQEGAGCLEPGEVFEVPAEIAGALLAQADNFEAVGKESK